MSFQTITGTRSVTGTQSITDTRNIVNRVIPVKQGYPGTRVVLGYSGIESTNFYHYKHYKISIYIL